MTSDTSAPPTLRLLLVGRRADDLARSAAGHIPEARCQLARDLASALDVLAGHAVDAVVCALDAAEGRRLFQIMHACYGDVWRVLVTDGAEMPVDATAAASLADACLSSNGEPAAPWHLVAALRLVLSRR